MQLELPTQQQHEGKNKDPSERKTLAALLAFYPQLGKRGSKMAGSAVGGGKQSHRLPVGKVKL